MTIEVNPIHWGVNYKVATVRHVLGEDETPLCNPSRGTYMGLEDAVSVALGDPDRLRDLLFRLPVCSRCRPIARMRGVGV